MFNRCEAAYQHQQSQSIRGKMKIVTSTDIRRLRKISFMTANRAPIGCHQMKINVYLAKSILRVRILHSVPELNDSISFLCSFFFFKMKNIQNKFIVSFLFESAHTHYLFDFDFFALIIMYLKSNNFILFL